MYHKIRNLFKRDPNTHKLLDEMVCPEIDNNRYWVGTEKLDGMNIRVTIERNIVVSAVGPFHRIMVGGKTENATMQDSWIEHVLGYFAVPKLITLPEELWDSNDRLVIYGELCGPKINGNPHRLDHLKFAMFDVEGKRFLPPDLVARIALHFNVPTPRVLFHREGLAHIIAEYRFGLKNQMVPGEYLEGVVLRPFYGDLFDRFGNRLIFKLKLRDLR